MSDDDGGRQGLVAFVPVEQIVALVASAGGLDAVERVLEGLPADFPAAVVVLQHVSPNHPSSLPSILARHARLAVRPARHGDRLRPGHVLVAPPGAHLLVRPNGTVALSKSAPVHYVRPSADVLFESMAAAFDGRAIAVVLSGMGSDGAEGARTLTGRGGVVIAQDEETSAFFAMPHAAIVAGGAKALPIDDIAPALCELVAARA